MISIEKDDEDSNGVCIVEDGDFDGDTDVFDLPLRPPAEAVPEPMPELITRPLGSAPGRLILSLGGRDA